MIDGFEKVHETSCTDEEKTQVTRRGYKFPSSWHPYPGWIRTRAGHIGKTIEAHARLTESTAVHSSIQSIACPVRTTTENFPRRLRRPRAVVPKCIRHQLPKKTAREYRRSQASHCSSEHMIAVVALIYVNMSVSPRENAIKNILEHCLVRNHQITCGRQQAKRLKMHLCVVDALGCAVKVGNIRRALE